MGHVRLHHLPEGCDIEPVIAGRVELDRVTGDEQEGRFRRAVADHPAQVGEGVAQVAEGVSVRPIGPQQSGQHLAAVRPIRFHGQISQQCPDFVGFETGDGLPIQRHLERSQQGKRQMSHRSSPEKVRSNSATIDIIP